MKQFLLFIFIVSSGYVNAQDSTCRRVQFEFKPGEFVEHIEYVYHTQNGLGNPDSVIVIIDKVMIDSLKIPVDLIRKMSYETCNEATKSLKEQTSFELLHSKKAIMMFSNQKGQPVIYMSLDYLGQNSYGAKKSSRISAYFNLNGELINTNTF
jgi:hypothetical protein